MRVAIVGSRGYPDPDEVRAYVRALPAGTVVVTGGAVGVDMVAEAAAREAGLEVIVYLPDYDKYGRRAPLMRNQKIARDCDRLVAFWDGMSTGTMHTVNVARKRGIPVEIRSKQR